MAAIDDYMTVSGKRYRVRYRLPDTRQASKGGFKTKRDAERWLHENEAARHRGEMLDPIAGKATVGALGAEWLASRAHLKPSSNSAYESAWRIHVEPKWGNRQVAGIRPSEVQAWIAELGAPSAVPEKRGPGRPRSSKGLSPTMVRRCHDIIAGVLDAAVSDGRISRNPARGAKLPRKTKRRHNYLTRAEVEALADAAGERGLIVRTLALTGIRWGELAGLNVGDVDLERRRLHIERTASRVDGYVQIGTPKDHEQRVVAFPASLADALREQVGDRSPDAILFPYSHGGHMVTPTVSEGSWYDRALAGAGLPPDVTIHDLRHTYASLAIRSGANPKVVQRQLGHASISQTMDTYADLWPDDLNAAADALDDMGFD
ncbi:tyrosine-type recombinase/integrase [Gryllotalpicola daejeonensis]